MVMRKPTDLEGKTLPEGGAAGAALPYDPEEWERRLAVARERRAKILDLRGAAPDHAAEMRSPGAPGLRPATGGATPRDAGTAPADGGARSRAEAPGGTGSGTGFEGRMDRIARAVEAARARAAAVPESAEVVPALGAERAALPQAARPEIARPQPARPEIARPQPIRPERPAAVLPAATHTAPRQRRFPWALVAAAAAAAVVAPAVYLGSRPTAPGIQLAPPVEAAEPGVLAAAEVPEAEMPPLRPAAVDADPVPAPLPLPLLSVAFLPARPSSPLGTAPEPPGTPAPLAAAEPASPDPAPAAVSAIPIVPPEMPMVASPSPALPADASAAAQPPAAVLPDAGSGSPADAAAAAVSDAGSPADADAAVASDAGAPAEADAVATVAPVADAGSYILAINAAPGASPAEIARVAAALAGAGFPDRRAQSVNFTVSRTHVRYYHAADADTAREIAGRIDAETRDLTHFRPSPPAGKIEVWIAGTAPAVRRASGAAGAPQPLPNPVEAARHIGQALRHLVDTFPANERP